MNIQGLFGKIISIFKPNTAATSRKYTHLKGKNSEKVVKAAHLYANCQAKLQKEITTYSNLKGRVVSILASDERALKHLKSTLAAHKNTIQSLPKGRNRSLLIQKSSILLEQGKHLKARIQREKAALKQLTGQHKEKYEKLNGSIKKLQKYLLREAPKLKAITKNSSKSKVHKQAKVKASKRPPKKYRKTAKVKLAPPRNKPLISNERRTQAIPSLDKFNHLQEDQRAKALKAQNMLERLQNDLQSTIHEYSNLKADITAHLKRDQDALKEMRTTLKKNKAAYKKLKAGSVERTRIANLTKLLLKKYEATKNRVLSSQKLLRATEMKHQQRYLELSASITKLEEALRRLEKK